MFVTTLASGSGGNSTLLESVDGFALLVDAGLRADLLEQRLEAAGRRPRDIDAILLTHRHRDHTRGTTDFARKHKARVWAVRRTMKAIGSETKRKLQRLIPDGDRPVELGPFRVWPVEVVHDAPQPRAFLIESEHCRYGHITDLGCTEGRVGDVLTACDGIYLEFNHDREMVRASEYPPMLKKRILSDEGHLSNEQSAELLSRLRHPRLTHLWLAHLSQVTNTQELALAAAAAALGEDAARVTVRIAKQDEPGPTVDLRVAGEAAVTETGAVEAGAVSVR